MDQVGYEVRNRVATLTLTRAEKRNALTPAMVESLRTLAAEALADPDVRVLALAGEGPSFCAGADLSLAGEQASAELTSQLAGFLQEWLVCPKPTVARVQGPAAGGGNGLVAACDVVVASTAASFALREVRVGVVPAVIAVPLLQRLTPAAVRELALSGRSMDADEARDVGLVDWVVGPSLLDSKVHQVTTELIKGGPGAQAASKKWLAKLTAAGSADALAAAARLSAEVFGGTEASEGKAAFRERRPPRW